MAEQENQLNPLAKRVLANRLALLERVGGLERAYFAVVAAARRDRNVLANATRVWAESGDEVRRLLDENTRLTTQLLDDNRALAQGLMEARAEAEFLRHHSAKLQ